LFEQRHSEEKEFCFELHFCRNYYANSKQVFVPCSIQLPVKISTHCAVILESNPLYIQDIQKNLQHNNAYVHYYKPSVAFSPLSPVFLPLNRGQPEPEC